MLFNIYSHLLAFTRIYSHSKLIITARTKFPRGFLHIELKVILDLDTIVCLIRTLLYGESEIHAIQCQVVSGNAEGRCNSACNITQGETGVCMEEEHYALCTMHGGGR